MNLQEQKFKIIEVIVIHQVGIKSIKIHIHDHDRDPQGNNQSIKENLSHKEDLRKIEV